MTVNLRKIMSSLSLNKLKKRTPQELPEKTKKKVDRFDGLSEEEIQKYTLPDYLKVNLDIVIVGINPSLMAAHRGRYYAGPGNHFYKLLHESGLIPRYVSFEEDYKLLQYGIGLTNIVTRPTRSSAELKRTEIKEGSKVVEDKLKFYKPKIAVFNGKCIYEVFANKTNKLSFNFGLQPESICETAVWVVPSSSARCANFPRMVDKLHFYTALKKYLLFLKGEIKRVDLKEFSFEGKCKQYIPQTSKMWRRKNMSAFLHGGRIANKQTVCLDTSEENIAVAHSTEFIVKRMALETNNQQCSEMIENEKCIEKQNSEFAVGGNIKESTVDDKELEETNPNIHTKDDLYITNNKLEVATINHLEHTQDKKSNKTLSKIRKKKKDTEPSIKLVQKYKTGNSDTLDFVSLIKQRLNAKSEDVSDLMQENKKKRSKSFSTKSKLEKFCSSNNAGKDTDLHDASPDDS